MRTWRFLPGGALLLTGGLLLMLLREAKLLFAADFTRDSKPEAHQDVKGTMPETSPAGSWTAEVNPGAKHIEVLGRNATKHLKPPSVDLEMYLHELGASHEWAAENVPYFECNDADVTRAYWYRWRLFHMHVEETLDGFVITEFLHKVFWAGPHNTISCPAGHHIMEGRWVKDRRIVDEYSQFWFRRRRDPEDKKVWEKMYTFWAASSVYKHFLISGNKTFIVDLFPDLERNYASWLETHYHPVQKCMFQACHADGEENSAGLDGCRPTINGVMYGEAAALAAIARVAGDASKAAHYVREAAKWQSVILSQLWSEDLQFFVTKSAHAPPALWKELHEGRLVTYFGCLACPANRTCPPPTGWPPGQRVPVRELQGLTSPWYFNAIPPEPEATLKYSVGFRQLRDPDGFDAKWGPTTCERRHDCYNFTTDAQCNWNGGVWPFETSKAGTALINLLQRYPSQPHASAADFYSLLRTYARAHTQTHAEGAVPPHVDEDLHPDEGYWITRRKLFKNPGDPLKNRGDHYFHSTYCDLVISGLVGVQAPEEVGMDSEANSGVEFIVNPLLPLDNSVRWFALRHLEFRNRTVDIAFDLDGSKYNIGTGLFVWMDGKLAAKSETATRLEIHA